MITSTRQEMGKFWIHIKSSVRALLQVSKDLHQRIPELKLCHEFPRNVLLPLLPAWPCPHPCDSKALPAPEDATQGKKNRGIAEVMLQLELILQPCEQAGELWKNPAPFSSLQWFCWAPTSSTLLTPLHFKPWLSEFYSKAAHGEECWKRNR